MLIKLTIVRKVYFTATKCSLKIVMKTVSAKFSFVTH